MARRFPSVSSCCRSPNQDVRWRLERRLLLEQLPAAHRQPGRRRLRSIVVVLVPLGSSSKRNHGRFVQAPPSESLFTVLPPRFEVIAHGFQAP